MSGSPLAVVTGGRTTVTSSPDRDELGLLLATGSVVAGKYRIDDELGRGGMGIVYRAAHLSLGEAIALKVLSSEAAKRSEAVARFLREARACARLRNDHVVRVLDAGTLEDGTPYVAMELLDGSDLGALIRDQGPLPIPEAVEYVLQACKGLELAHANGIVHRDIKPSNLFLTRDRKVKLLDFGIAKMADPKASTEAVDSLTASTTVLGSPAYMAPEQIRHASNVDARTDVWSLGVVLFELVSGRLPFDGESAPALLAAISADPPLPLRRAKPDAPRALERIIASCLERDRGRRPAGISDLVELLEPFRSNQPVRSKRNPALALVGAGLVITAVITAYVTQPRVEHRLSRIASEPAARVKAVHITPPPAPEPVAPTVAPTAAAAPTPPRTATRRVAAPKRDPIEASVETATAHRK